MIHLILDTLNLKIYIYIYMGKNMGVMSKQMIFKDIDITPIFLAIYIYIFLMFKVSKIKSNHP